MVYLPRLSSSAYFRSFQLLNPWMSLPSMCGLHFQNCYIITLEIQNRLWNCYIVTLGVDDTNLSHVILSVILRDTLSITFVFHKVYLKVKQDLGPCHWAKRNSNGRFGIKNVSNRRYLCLRFAYVQYFWYLYIRFLAWGKKNKLAPTPPNYHLEWVEPTKICKSVAPSTQTFLWYVWVVVNLGGAWILSAHFNLGKREVNGLWPFRWPRTCRWHTQ